MILDQSVEVFAQEKVLTTHPGDAGAGSGAAGVVAAVEALDNRASAPDGGVRQDIQDVSFIVEKGKWISSQ